MARRRIVALAAAGGLALIVLPASVAPAQTAPSGGTTSTPAAGTTSTPAAGTTSTPAAGGTGGTAPSGSTTQSPGSKTAPSPGAAPTPSTPAKPAGTTSTVTASASTGGTPVGLILLAILGALLVVIGLFVLLARFMGWDPERWQRTVQTWREAGYQTETVILEFGDWTRRGR